MPSDSFPFHSSSTREGVDPDGQNMSRARDALDIAAGDQRLLASLCQKARAYQQLGDQVRQLLPTEMAEHCRVACIDNRELILITPTPAWAARIKMQAATLLHSLHGQQSDGTADLGYDRIGVRVVPLKTENTVPQQRRQLSEAARKALAGLAETTRNPELAAVIRRTLKRAKK